MDSLSKQRRSWNMSRIRSKGTRPELALTAAIRQLGFLVETHVSHLPGSPDLILPRARIAIFLHGCFWHRHGKCKYAYTPKSRIRFWLTKFDENKRRDRRVRARLRAAGWRVLVVWECDLRRKPLRNHLKEKITRLRSTSSLQPRSQTVKPPV